MIEVKNANKFYNKGKRNRIHVIDHTTLSFGESGLVAILGPSGCGKTTLLNTIGGLDKPDSGKITVNGKRINSVFSARTDNLRNKHIGYIFQNYQLIDDMTVFDNVALALRMLGVRKKDKLQSCVNYVLETVGMYRYRNRPAGMLSGGERQRVGIARALVKNPDIIIADEPTGNLDSRNSLEVMNIIKAISKDKLVILVTHEEDLARFYADRIIELKDGKIISDGENVHDNTLDYRIENKIYLKDMPERRRFKSPTLNIEYYSEDGTEPLNVKLIVRGGNLYIQSDRKIQPVDEDSAIELVNDHYKAISKDDADESVFDFTRLETGKKRKRYHSIFNPVSMLVSGFKKIGSYKLIKKFLLMGFVASSMFIMYSLSNVAGVLSIDDSEFITADKSYINVVTPGNSVSQYEEYSSIPGVDYIIPGNGRYTVTFDYSDLYFQTSGANDRMSGSMSVTDTVSPDKVIIGRYPENDHEFMIDRMLADDLMENGACVMVGITDPEKLIGMTTEIPNVGTLTVAGITDTGSPCLYFDRGIIRDLLMNASNQDYYYDYAVKYDGPSQQGGENEDNTATVKNIEYYRDKLTLKSGSWPENDYEIIVNYSNRYDLKIGKEISGKINGINLKVVGYYETKEYSNDYYSNANTAFYRYLADTTNYVVRPTDKEEVLSWFEMNLVNAYSIYDTDKITYTESMKAGVKNSLVIAGIVILISLIEIYLMLRSSFLSRIREVGTLRAIGLKKKDIYKMFLGEILAITILTSLFGFGMMGYILANLVKISYFAKSYVFDLKVILASVILVFVFNIIAGLLPVFVTLRKTPAAILSRTDAD